jgi:hypothetical protein
MSLRCGCAREGDEIVFGSRHECSLPERTAVPGEPLPPLPECAYPPDAVALTPLVPSWVFVVPNQRRYEETLSDDTEPGDLG